MAAHFVVKDGALTGGDTVAIGRFDQVDDIQNLYDRVKEATGFEIAVVNPRLIVDELVLLVAANKAAHLRRLKKLKTGSVHTELIYQLSPATNIAGAISTFGVAALGSSPGPVLVCVFDPTTESLEAICPHIGGRPIAVTESYGTYVDATAVAKVYKLTAEQLDTAAIVDAVVTKIAVKQPC